MFGKSKRLEVTGTVEAIGDTFFSGLLTGKVHEIVFALRSDGKGEIVEFLARPRDRLRCALLIEKRRIRVTYSLDRHGRTKMHGMQILWPERKETMSDRP